MLLTLAETQKYLSSTGKNKIGFTCSCFDILHAGHILMLKDASSVCDILIVGLQTDPTIDTKYREETGSKNKCLQSYEERLIQLEACKYVDLIITYSTEDDLLNILQTIKPNIRILGTDWKNKKYTGHHLNDIEIHWHNRNHSYSTSDLRNRLLQLK